LAPGTPAANSTVAPTTAGSPNPPTISSITPSTQGTLSPTVLGGSSSTSPVSSAPSANGTLVPTNSVSLSSQPRLLKDRTSD
jgi:hypothetical protein